MARKNNNTFICEICHCETPRQYEGAEPNVCADCLPTEESRTSKYNDYFG